MLEQTFIQDATPTVRLAGVERDSVLSAERQAQVTACLDHLCAREAGAAPLREREELRAEMQTALEQLVAANLELGSDLDTAAVTALQQLRRVYIAPTTAQTAKLSAKVGQRKRDLRAAMLPLGMFSAFYLADASHLAWQTWAHVTNLIGTGPGQITSDGIMALQDHPAVTAFYRFELCVVPLVVGLITGLMLRQRAGRALLTSLAMLAVVAILLPGFCLGLSYAGLWPGELHFIPDGLIPSPLPGLSGVVFWTSLGYAGAQAGNWLGRKGTVLMRRTDRLRAAARKHTASQS